MRTTGLSLLALLLTLTACDQLGPGSPLSHSAAMFWCGPADGPATAIVLAQQPVQSPQAPYPSAYIMIWQSVSTIAGHTFSVTSADANADYRPDPNTYEAPTAGTITITSVDNANTVRGLVSIRFPSRIVELPFTAPWINSGFLCA